MSLTLTTPPGEEAISLAQAKQFLRVDHDTDDTLIEACITAARQQAEAVTGLAFVTQGWRLVRARWPEAGIALPRPPVQSVTDVAVSDGEGGWTSLPEEDWQLSPSTPARLLLTALPPYPDRAIRVDFTTGFGDADAVPETLKQAIRLLTAHYYERREPAVVSAIRAVPNSVAALLAPWREVRL